MRRFLLAPRPYVASYCPAEGAPRWVPENNQNACLHTCSDRNQEPTTLAYHIIESGNLTCEVERQSCAWNCPPPQSNHVRAKLRAECANPALYAPTGSKLRVRLSYPVRARLTAGCSHHPAGGL